MSKPATNLGPRVAQAATDIVRGGGRPLVLSTGLNFSEMAAAWLRTINNRPKEMSL